MLKKAKEKLIVALDYDNLEEVENLVELLGDNILIYKVGLESYLSTKGKIIDYLHKKNKKVFLDLKFHDITNTVVKACKSILKEKVFMFNIHCSNGKKTMEKVAELVKENNSESLLIGVTILTNLVDEDISELFNNKISIEDIILNMATLAKNSNMDGIVCSPLESKKIKEKLGNNFITVCPGVRLKTDNENNKKNDDQSRIMTPYEAIKNNVDFLVVGRPITQSENPLEVTKLILNEISLAIEK